MSSRPRAAGQPVALRPCHGVLAALAGSAHTPSRAMSCVRLNPATRAGINTEQCYGPAPVIRCAARAPVRHVWLWQTGPPLRCQFEIGTSPGSAPSTVTSSRRWLSGSGAADLPAAARDALGQETAWPLL